MNAPKLPVFRAALQLFSSLRLSVVLFAFLLLLTYLGTVEQVENGLYLTQKKYFESFVLVHNFFGVVPVPLPGVYTLLVLLAINLSLGGLLRMRKGLAQAGILVAHLGIILLLVGGFITYEFAVDGHMTLYENERASVFKSYHEWEVAIASEQGGARTEFIIPHDRIAGLEGAKSTTFTTASLPFDLTLSGFEPNAMPQPKGPMFEVDVPVIDGFFLQALSMEKENERNVAGLYATITDKASGASTQTLLWGMQQKPATVAFQGQTYDIDLRRKQFPLPFTIVLDKFTRELHPRTSMAKVFMSDVTKIEDGTEQKIKISMNQPLRHKGYTFYQASWGPSDAGPNDPLFSSFAVVRNPADQFPLYACIITTTGLLIHFSLKLRKYLRQEQKRHA